MYRGRKQGTQGDSRFQAKFRENLPGIWWRMAGFLLALAVLPASFTTAFAQDTEKITVQIGEISSTQAVSQSTSQLAAQLRGQKLPPEEPESPAGTQQQDGDTPLGWTGLDAQIPSSANLPDLQALPLSDIRLVIDPVTGERLLRFTNRIINAGTGPIELHGQRDLKTNEVQVSQRIQDGYGNRAGSPGWKVLLRHEPRPLPLGELHRL